MSKKELTDALKKSHGDKKYDFDLRLDKEEGSIDENEYINLSKKYFNSNTESVLGLDIYKYSDYDEEKQNFIPFVFNLLLDETTELLIKQESKLFGSDFVIKPTENFISTGDGGYIFFFTPFHALVFNLYFYSLLHLFNTEHLFPKLKKYIGEFFIRSAMTHDKIFRFEGQPYGRAIISNARILSKDKLNRFLIDRNTFEYFNRVCNGIENISLIEESRLNKIIGNNGKTFFLEKNNNPIKNIHVQKLDDTFAKNSKLTIYNVEIQSRIIIEKTDKILAEFFYSIGNLNTNTLT